MKGYFFKKRYKVFSRLFLVMMMLLTHAGCQVNVALHKPARQSSTLPRASVNSEAGNAVDGDMNGDWNDGSCAHTDVDHGGTAQWWLVDLLQEYIITSVHILYRQDNVSTNFGKFVIEIFWSNPIAFPNATTTLCHHYTGSNFPGNDTLACTNPVLGRFVRIRKVKPSHYKEIALCEVMVFGSLVPRTSDANCLFLNRVLQEQQSTYLNATGVTSHGGSYTRAECAGKCLREERCQGFKYSPAISECVTVLDTWDPFDNTFEAPSDLFYF